MLDSSFKSFGDSLLHDLSSQSWRRGIVNFFSESIPFSFSSGNEYAALVSTCIQNFSHPLDHPLAILECGAGNGVFAKKCIPMLADKKVSFEYLVTEHSSSLVNDFETIATIRDLDYVNTQLLDIHDFSLAKPFHVGILSYLLDTCPVKILELRAGQLYEWRVAVSVKEDAVLQLMQDGHPVTWDKLAIEHWLSKPLTADRLALLSRIHDCLTIRWESQACVVSDLDSTGILASWLAQQSPEDQGFFNFSSSWWTLLDSLRQYAADSFMVLFYDFASTHPTQFKTLEESYGRFGVCYFYSVPFFLFQAYCDYYDVTFFSSQFPDSDNQIAIMTSIKDSSFTDKVQVLLGQEEPGKIGYEYTLKIQDALSLDACLELIKGGERALSVEQRSDYVFLFSIASTLYQFQAYDQVIYYTDLILEDYGDVSLNALLLKAKALRKRGFIQDALSLINKGIHRVPTYDLLYLEKVFIAQELNQMEMVKESLVLYFDRVMLNPQWHLLDVLNVL
ncbi:hypothetical protein DID74_01190 [Candidatus Marinamargulisbacteria bacterium SCGC AG-333-B06]|nr:hypothetical protein DID74_01190 [Candidatus Marinamargulisbacteria bacterium SCGC AG-333-B06]